MFYILVSLNFYNKVCEKLLSVNKSVQKLFFYYIFLLQHIITVIKYPLVKKFNNSFLTSYSACGAIFDGIFDVDRSKTKLSAIRYM